MSRMSGYLIGLDLGTSAIKGVLISTGGEIISREKAALEYQRGENGEVQFDAEYYYSLIAGVIRNLVRSLPGGTSVAALSMASASGNTLLVAKSGKPLRPAISWLDSRVTDEMEQIFGKLSESDVYGLIGWPLLKMFPLAHLSWLRCHNPGELETADRICMTTDYIYYRMTDHWGIDPSTATTFYLQDQVNHKWHLPYLEMLGIPEEKLPAIFPTGTVIGEITEEASAETGLPAGTAVVLGSFDHPSAARGSGVLKEGQLLISCGTSWVGFYPVKERADAVRHKLLIDPFLSAEGLWGAMFSLPAIADGIDRTICRYISDGPLRYQEFDRLAAAAKPGAGGLMMNPAADVQTVDTSRYSRSDIARAVMEGTAFLLKAKIDSLKNDVVDTYSVTMVGGPSETAPWPQIVCDILGVELSVVNGSCAGAVGAAIIAGIGAGIYADEEDALKKVVFQKTVRTPDKETHKIYRKLFTEFANKLL